MSKIGFPAPWLGVTREVAVSPATTAIPTTTDVIKLPITYALSNLTGRGRLRITNTAAIAVGLVIADRTASGISCHVLEFIRIG
jgi:uncharacterized membrane protein YkgB